MPVPFQRLGQSGVRMEFGPTVVYVDPYLSEHVYDVEQTEDLRRMVPIKLPPGQVRDADWVLVTHRHMDHCDPKTLGPMLEASPGARVVCPNVCREDVLALGVAAERIVIADGRVDLGAGLALDVVPAAHPEVERDADGHLVWVGYVLSWEGRRYLHAGDTSVTDEMIAGLRAHRPIDVAFLPVNERNYFREKRSIIGNMTLREAFLLAADLAVSKLVPMHFDMFAPNRVYPEEIELLYRLESPPFSLQMEDGAV